MHFVNLRQLGASTCDVGRELDRLGFYDDLVHGVDVYLVATGVAYPRQSA